MTDNCLFVILRIVHKRMPCDLPPSFKIDPDPGIQEEGVDPGRTEAMISAWTALRQRKL